MSKGQAKLIVVAICVLAATIFFAVAKENLAAAAANAKAKQQTLENALEGK